LLGLGGRLNQHKGDRHQQKADASSIPYSHHPQYWQKRLGQLVAARAQIAEKRHAIVVNGPGRLRAVELDQQLIALKYTARNLENVIRGEKLGFPEGGISVVR
jgi:hypothetical protein